jgi:hypothetical protein
VHYLFCELHDATFCRDFSWWIGFTALALTPRKVTYMLPTFVEMAFLQKHDLGILDAAQRAFNRPELHTHTGVLICSRDEASNSVSLAEFVYSNSDRPWGMALPECPVCERDLWVTANFGKDGKVCRFRCRYCGSRSKMEVPQPGFAQPCQGAHMEGRKYFMIPFPHPVGPWSTVAWLKNPAGQGKAQPVGVASGS